MKHEKPYKRRFVCKIFVLQAKRPRLRKVVLRRADRSGGGRFGCPVSGASIGVLGAVDGKMGFVFSRFKGGSSVFRTWS